MKDDELVETGKEVVRKRGRGGKENFPSVIANSKAEDVQRIMKNCLRWYQMPRIESDDDCEQRLLDFFVGCMENGEHPTVEKMCLALGYARNTVFDWESRRTCSERRSNMIKKAKALIATLESEMVTEGKINPVVYIFRAKNYFGMKDQQDVVVTPHNPQGELLDQKQLEQKIDADVIIDEQ